MDLTVTSQKSKEIIDVTDNIEKIINETGIKQGAVLIFLKHTTAALTVGEVGEGTDEDLIEVSQKIIPKMNFRHQHNPAHAPDHMIGSIIGPGLTVPIENGNLSLGTWQRVLVVEENGPRSLNISLTFLGK